MNIQTEHLEDHTARFTVEVEAERFEQVKQRAARELARRVRIPGFRKGKVPYRILVQNGLEGQIIMDAVESLSQEIYRETMENSDIEPYGPGAFEDYTLEPAITFVYTVPLQPTVELGDYRSIRRDYEEPEVTDEMVDKAMKRLQEQEALVEESSKPVAVGNRVTVDIHSEFADDAPESAAEETDDDADADDDTATHVPAKGDGFIHEHDAVLNLDPENEPILPGFIENLVDANVGDDVIFTLTVPDDNEEFKDIAGREVEFNITVNKIEMVTLPSLNDDLAARITEDEEEPLTLLDLRVRMRENIKEQMERNAKDEFASEVVADIVKDSKIAFPEAMVEEQVDAMIDDLDGRLRQQGMTIDNYIQVTGQTKEDLAEQYREPAIDSLKRALVLRELVVAENIVVTDEAISARIDEMLAQFGEQSEQIRPMFDTPRMRSNMQNDLLQQAVLDRIVSIAKGEDPPRESPAVTVDASTEEKPSESEDAADAEVESGTADAVSEEADESV